MKLHEMFDDHDYDPPTNMCPDCEGTGKDQEGGECERCYGHGEVFEAMVSEKAQHSDGGKKERDADVAAGQAALDRARAAAKKRKRK